MRLERDLTNYTVVKIPQYIVEVNINTLDFEKLADELVEFDKELKWDEMWTVDGAKNRLLNGWRLVIYMPETAIKGWYWLDNTGEPRNLYVNKLYRRRGIGKEMHFAVLNICKEQGMQKVGGHIDDWNIASIDCIKKAGWTEVQS